MSEFSQKDHDMAEKNTHISDDEIRKDIEDTREEIKTMEREIHGLRIINDRMSNFKADAREAGIKERKVFIANLKLIQAIRAGR